MLVVVLVPLQRVCLKGAGLAVAVFNCDCICMCLGWGEVAVLI